MRLKVVVLLLEELLIDEVAVRGEVVDVRVRYTLSVFQITGVMARLLEVHPVIVVHCSLISIRR